MQEDSQATFTQEITYQFQTGYHGQYVTLGSADPLPKGFKIHRHPEVEAYVDGEKREGRESVYNSSHTLTVRFPKTGKTDRKSTRLNSSHIQKSRMPSSA